MTTTEKCNTEKKQASRGKLQPSLWALSLASRARPLTGLYVKRKRLVSCTPWTIVLVQHYFDWWFQKHDWTSSGKSFNFFRVESGTLCEKLPKHRQPFGLCYSLQFTFSMSLLSPNFSWFNSLTIGMFRRELSRWWTWVWLYCFCEAVMPLYFPLNSLNLLTYHWPDRGFFSGDLWEAAGLCT